MLGSHCEFYVIQVPDGHCVMLGKLLSVAALELVY